jgi:hypothetical protein
MSSAVTFSAKDIIQRFKSRAYYEDKVIAHEANWLFKPDIVTISRDHLVNEYEIKVALSDLRRELDYTDFATRDHEGQFPADFEIYIPGESREDWQKRRDAFNSPYKKGLSRHDNKYTKHRLYLFNDHGENRRSNYKPNRFYFIVPKELYIAEKQRLDKLPYGVIEAGYFASLKKCTRLHSDPIELHALWQVAYNLTAKIKSQ